MEQAAKGQDGLVMVVNKANSVTAVTKGDAKRMLLGQMAAWPGGGTVLMVLEPTHSSDHIAVLGKICGMKEADFTRYQMMVMFEGKPMLLPHEEASIAAVKSFVRDHPGAVGFVHSGDLDKELKAVLTVE
jgi:hypothetical protein